MMIKVEPLLWRKAACTYKNAVKFICIVFLVSHITCVDVHQFTLTLHVDYLVVISFISLLICKRL